MNSFSLEPPSTQLWFTLIELKVFSLVPHPFGGVLRRGAVGLRVGVPTVANGEILRGGDVGRHFAGHQVLAVRRTERAVEIRKQTLRVETIWNVSCCVRSKAPKKCALFWTIGPPNEPPN